MSSSIKSSLANATTLNAVCDVMNKADTKKDFIVLSSTVANRIRYGGRAYNSCVVAKHNVENNKSGFNSFIDNSMFVRTNYSVETIISGCEQFFNCDLNNGFVPKKVAARYGITSIVPFGSTRQEGATGSYVHNIDVDLFADSVVQKDCNYVASRFILPARMTSIASSLANRNDCSDNAIMQTFNFRKNDMDAIDGRQRNVLIDACISSTIGDNRIKRIVKAILCMMYLGSKDSLTMTVDEATINNGVNPISYDAPSVVSEFTKRDSVAFIYSSEPDSVMYNSFLALICGDYPFNAMVDKRGRVFKGRSFNIKRDASRTVIVGSTMPKVRSRAGNVTFNLHEWTRCTFKYLTSIKSLGKYENCWLIASSMLMGSVNVDITLPNFMGVGDVTLNARSDFEVAVCENIRLMTVSTATKVAVLYRSSVLLIKADLCCHALTKSGQANDFSDLNSFTNGSYDRRCIIYDSYGKYNLGIVTEIMRLVDPLNTKDIKLMSLVCPLDYFFSVSKFDKCLTGGIVEKFITALYIKNEDCGAAKDVVRKSRDLTCLIGSREPRKGKKYLGSIVGKQKIVDKALDKRISDICCGGDVVIKFTEFHFDEDIPESMSRDFVETELPDEVYPDYNSDDEEVDDDDSVDESYKSSDDSEEEEIFTPPRYGSMFSARADIDEELRAYKESEIMKKFDESTRYEYPDKVEEVEKEDLKSVSSVYSEPVSSGFDYFDVVEEEDDEFKIINPAHEKLTIFGISFREIKPIFKSWMHDPEDSKNYRVLLEKIGIERNIIEFDSGKNEALISKKLGVVVDTLFSDDPLAAPLIEFYSKRYPAVLKLSMNVRMGVAIDPAQMSQLTHFNENSKSVDDFSTGNALMDAYIKTNHALQGEASMKSAMYETSSLEGSSSSALRMNQDLNLLLFTLNCFIHNSISNFALNRPFPFENKNIGKVSVGAHNNSEEYRLMPWKCIFTKAAVSILSKIEFTNYVEVLNLFYSIYKKCVVQKSWSGTFRGSCFQHNQCSYQHPSRFETIEIYCSEINLARQCTYTLEMMQDLSRAREAFHKLVGIDFNYSNYKIIKVLRKRLTSPNVDQLNAYNKIMKLMMGKVAIKLAEFLEEYKKQALHK